MISDTMPLLFRWMRCAGLLLLLLVGKSGYAQQKIKIDRADALEGGKDKQGTSYQKLIGDVKLVQEDTRIYGDSVILYRDPQRHRGVWQDCAHRKGRFHHHHRGGACSTMATKNWPRCATTWCTATPA